MDKTIINDASLDAAMEERSTVETLRDDSKLITVNSEKIGRITAYKVKILVRDKPAIEGTFTREEVDLMYRLYSSEGSNLTQRTVSRYFPNYTFQDFKKILRAFNITKASSPFAPHVLEEKSLEELTQLVLQNKENDFLRKLEQDRARLTENKLKEITGKYFDLKQQIADFKEFLGEIHLDINITVKQPVVNFTTKTLLVYLSDMHIGADVSHYSLFENEFNFEVAQARMQKIEAKINQIAITTKCTNIIICNLGDSLDGYNGETTRGEHLLPQNMNNKDQFKSFLKLLSTLFTNLSTSGLFSSIKYYAVEGGNHKK
jgi:hypothetical protein